MGFPVVEVTAAGMVARRGLVADSEALAGLGVAREVVYSGRLQHCSQIPTHICLVQKCAQPAIRPPMLGPNE